MQTRRRLDLLLSLLLLCVFASSVLMVLMLGARSYRHTVEAGQYGSGTRSCVAYVQTKLRHYDAPGAVVLGEFDGCQALILREEIEGMPYQTMLYAYDGQLRELFCLEGVELTASDGEAVLPVQTLTFTAVTPQLVEVACTGADGAQLRQQVCLHAGEVGQ